MTPTTIQIEFTPEALATIERLGELGVRPAVQRGLLKGAHLVAGDAKIAARDSFQTRTGGLNRGITAWAESEAMTVAIGVHGNDPAIRYAWLLTDEEKTILPKGHPYLAIPLSPLRTRGEMSGAAKATTPRDFEGFFKVSKAGNLIFFGTGGEALAGATIKSWRKKLQDNGIIPLFVLKPSVTVKGRDVLRRTVEANVGKAAEAVNEEVAKLVS